MRRISRSNHKSGLAHPANEDDFLLKKIKTTPPLPKCLPPKLHWNFKEMVGGGACDDPDSETCPINLVSLKRRATFSDLHKKMLHAGGLPKRSREI